MRRHVSLPNVPASYFDAMYARNPDPWSFTTRWYEQRKYALTVAALPRPRYRNAFEPGCSIGVLTQLLAPRCERLFAGDRSAAAVATARQRLAPYPHVRVDQWELPTWPADTFDLVVLSEVVYYFDRTTRAQLLKAATESLEPGGHLVAVHWRHTVAEHPASGDRVHAELARQPRIARIARHEEKDFHLDVYARTPPPPRSVAEEEGLC
jgi:SAM-dependent methyltransferase